MTPRRPPAALIREGAVHYLFLVHADEAAVNALPAERRREIYSGHLALYRELTERGALRYAAPLEDSRATRTLGGDGVITDGPYAETKEQIGGIYVVECADAAEAEALARRFPAGPGHHVEIRPVTEV
jgi:hypothetical protein